MAGKDIEFTQEQFEVTLKAVTGQAQAHGLDVEDPNMVDFLRLTAEVQAQQHAEVLQVNRLLNRIPPKVFEEYK
jgi:hypothetical protein